MTGERQRRVVRIIAWLLTPVVAWAASFLGGWVAAALARHVAHPGRAVLWLGAGALVGAVLGVGTWAWLLLRDRGRRDTVRPPETGA